MLFYRLAGWLAGWLFDRAECDLTSRIEKMMGRKTEIMEISATGRQTAAVVLRGEREKQQYVLIIRAAGQLHTSNSNMDLDLDIALLPIYRRNEQERIIHVKDMLQEGEWKVIVEAQKEALRMGLWLEAKYSWWRKGCILPMPEFEAFAELPWLSINTLRQRAIESMLLDQNGDNIINLLPETDSTELMRAAVASFEDAFPSQTYHGQRCRELGHWDHLRTGLAATYMRIAYSQRRLEACPARRSWFFGILGVDPLKMSSRITDQRLMAIALDFIVRLACQQSTQTGFVSTFCAEPQCVNNNVSHIYPLCTCNK